MGAGRVVVCGSRALPPEAVPVVRSAVRSLLAAGRSLAVGCAVGADAAAVSSVLELGEASRLSVWCAFGPVSPPWPAARVSAPGAWSGSAVQVVAAALHAGAGVCWWAGGGPAVPLRARLAGRSLACVRSAVGSGPGAGLVAFVSAPPSRPWGAGPFPSCGSGSWSSVAAAAILGLPVVVVPVGGLAGAGASALPALPVAGGGQWVPAGSGVWAGAWRWAPGRGLL